MKEKYERPETLRPPEGMTFLEAMMWIAIFFMVTSVICGKVCLNLWMGE